MKGVSDSLLTEEANNIVSLWRLTMKQNFPGDINQSQDCSPPGNISMHGLTLL